MSRRRRNTRANAPQATDAETGAVALRKFVIGLFDREDGRAANWPLIAETLFRAAFEALDEIPAGVQPDALLKQVHDGAYNRLVKNAAGTEAPQVEAVRRAAPEQGPSLRRDFRP